MAGFSNSGNAVEIQGVPVSSTAPTSNQVLEYNATTGQWTPTTGASSGITALTGDVTASGTGSVAATLVGTTNVESIISANTTVAGALQTSGGTMTGVLASTASYSSSSNKGAIAVGTTLSYSDSNIPITAVSNVNSYADVIIQNLSTGSSAYAAYAVSADGSTATASSYYSEYGVTSSTYSNGAGSLNQPNTTFLTSNSMDLAIGTTSANAIHFVTNNTSTDALTIASSGAVTIPGALTANGTSIPASSTLLTTASTINATQLQGVSVSSTTPTTSQVLEYNGTNWTPTTLSLGGIPSAALGTPPPSFWFSNAFAETYDIVATSSYQIGSGGTNVSTPVKGTVELVPIYLASGQTVTNICFFVTTAGSSATMYAGLYNQGGTRLAVTSSFTANAANTKITAALTSSYSVTTSGVYWIGLLVTNGSTTSPVLLGANLNVANYFSVALATTSVINSLVATGGTGQTTLPTTISTASANTSGFYPWCVLS